MNAIKGLARCLPLSRSISTSSHRARDLTRLKELQRKFQVDDGVPVHLKRGASDKLLFGIVCILLSAVMIDSALTVKKLIYPPKNN